MAGDAAGDRSIDFFIAHAGRDALLAERLYDLLAPHASVFVSSRSLAPGDLWDEELPRAMDRSRITVVLVSEDTPDAFYEREEIAIAIQRAREGKQRVIPVHIGRRREIYGLKRVHDILLTSTTPVERVAEMLLAVRDRGAPAEAPRRAPASPFAALTTGVGSSLLELEAFLTAYLGTEQDPAVFGGRNAALSQLDRWLATEGVPCALVAAPAGRGKSALITQWASGVAARNSADVVFVPISLRFRMARPSEVLSILGERLSWLVSGVQDDDPPDTPSGWRRRIAGLLSAREPDPRRPLLIIVDGMDEMAGWEDEQLPLPPASRGGIKTLVGARLLADRDAVAWREWLHWPGDATEAIDLPPLNRGEIAALLRKQLGVLPEPTVEQLAGRLTELTEGDPLVLGLYVEDLRQQLASDGGIDVGSIPDDAPGLAGYFDRWWSDQEQQWRGNQLDPIGEGEDAARILGVCAAALGPLREEELAELVQGRATSSIYLGRKLGELGRFLIGLDTGQGLGYTMAHPRLASHFKAEAESWREALLDYCRRGRREIETNGEAREWAYVLGHFGPHLQAERALHGELHTLVSPRWHAARQSLEGTDEGFLEDVGRAWSHADATLSNAGSPEALRRQLECALASAALHDLAGAVPDRLFVALVRERYWAPGRAFDRARRIAFIPGRVRALVNLAPYLSTRDLRRGVEVLRTLRDRSEGLKGVPVLARRLPPADARPILEEVLDRLPTVGDSWHRGVALLECCRAFVAIGDSPKAAILGRETEAWVKPLCLLEALAGEDPATLAEIEESAEAASSEHGYWSAWALAGLAPYLEEADGVRVLRRAAELGRTLEFDRHARQVIVGVARHAHRLGHRELARTLRESAPALSGWAMSELIAESEAKVWLTDWTESEFAAAAEAATSDPASERDAQLARLVDQAVELDWRDRINVLLPMAPWLENAPPRVLGRALDAIREHRNAYQRAETLAEFSRALPREARQAVLREALEPLEKIGDEGARGMALGSLAERMTAGPERQRWAQEALSLVRRAASYERAHGLAAVAGAMEPDAQVAVLAEALALYTEVDDFLKASVVREAARAYERLGFVHEAVETQAMFGTDEAFIEEITSVASGLDADFVRWALLAGDIIADPRTRAEALALPVTWCLEQSDAKEAGAVARLLAERYGYGTVAPQLPPEIAEDLSDVAPEQVREANDVVELARLLPLVAPDARSLAERRLRELILGDSSEMPREQLARLSELVDEALARSIVERADDVADPRWRAAILTAFLPGLSGEDRLSAIAAARKSIATIEGDDLQASHMAALIAAIGDETDFVELLSVTSGVCDLDYIRTEPLRQLVGVASKLPASLIAQWWSPTLRRLALRSRRDLLGDLRDCVPVLVAIAGEAGLIEAAKAVRDAAQWFSEAPPEAKPP